MQVRSSCFFCKAIRLSSLPGDGFLQSPEFFSEITAVLKPSNVKIQGQANQRKETEKKNVKKHVFLHARIIFFSNLFFFGGRLAFGDRTFGGFNNSFTCFQLNSSGWKIVKTLLLTVVLRNNMCMRLF